VRTQILKLPGADNGQPTDADMETVGELCLQTQYRGAFTGQTVTFLGYAIEGAHNNIFRPLSKAWEEATGATIHWIDATLGNVVGQIEQAEPGGALDADIVESGVALEPEMLGKELALPLPDWVASQIRIDDYVPAMQPPVGSWNGKVYRVALDGDTHLLNIRADVFADPELAAQWVRTSGGATPWAIPTTWPQIQAATAFLAGTETNGLPNYGFLDVCQPSEGLSWYFFASRAAAYVKHPSMPAWLFDPATMTPWIESPGFARALQEVIAALPYEPVEQIDAGTYVPINQFAAGQGALAVWWGDVASWLYTHGESAFVANPNLKAGFAQLPGSPEVFNRATNAWESLPSGPNVVANHAFGGWGLYVTRGAEQRGVSDAAWDLAAHLGGVDLALWLACYPSGFQPYRISQLDVDDWVEVGFDRGYAQSYLDATRAAYANPNVIAEPRIPGLFRYYMAAEDQLAGAFTGSTGVDETLAAIASAWEAITDDLGRDRLIAAYQAGLTTGR
jgi:multiple sugar transport system substrate-binding protein